MFRLEGIDHVALTVRDVVRSVRWYLDVLGLERRYEEEWGNFPAVVGVGNTSLALFQAKSDDAEPLESRGVPGFRHLAFRVDRGNFERAEESLRDRGIELALKDHGTAVSMYFLDPDGHQLEITTYEV